MKKLKKIIIFILFLLVFANSPFSGICLQTSVSLLSYVGMCVGSIFDESIRDDMNAIGFNPFNTSEEKVSSSNSVSFYKGIPIYRIEYSRSGSFCAIFLTKGYRSPSTIKHEFGHNIQQIILGPVRFLMMIGIPSALEWSERDYYNRPWEISADEFGGVSTRTHAESDLTRGNLYLLSSKFFGVFSYFFIIGEY